MKRKIFWSIVAVMIVIIMSKCFYTMDKNYVEYQNQMIKYETLTNEYNNQMNEYNKCKREIDLLNKEIIKYNEEISFTLKEIDINLQKKIEYYIENNYQRVPKILVKAIAGNIINISRDECIPPELTLAIIQTESSFNPLAVSKQHARGLMQIMPMWAKEFNVKLYDLHDIKTNIRIGIKVLKIHMEEHEGDLSQGLYYYVNKDSSYVDKVYKNMGLFISSSEKIGETNGVNK